MKSFSNAFDQCGLPCSQIAAQQHNAAGLEIGGQAAAKVGGFIGGVSVGRSSSLEVTRRALVGFWIKK